MVSLRITILECVKDGHEHDALMLFASLFRYFLLKKKPQKKDHAVLTMFSNPSAFSKQYYVPPNLLTFDNFDILLTQCFKKWVTNSLQTSPNT